VLKSKQTAACGGGYRTLQRLVSWPWPCTRPYKLTVDSAMAASKVSAELGNSCAVVSAVSSAVVCCWGVCPGDEAGLCRFDAHLAEFREHLEVEVSRLTASAQALTAHRGWWDNTQQVREGGGRREERVRERARGWGKGAEGLVVGQQLTAGGYWRLGEGGRRWGKGDCTGRLWRYCMCMPCLWQRVVCVCLKEGVAQGGDELSVRPGSLRGTLASQMDALGMWQSRQGERVRGS